MYPLCSLGGLNYEFLPLRYLYFFELLKLRRYRNLSSIGFRFNISLRRYYCRITFLSLLTHQFLY